MLLDTRFVAVACRDVAKKLRSLYEYAIVNNAMFAPAMSISISGHREE